jgi:hypothetical protein
MPTNFLFSKVCRQCPAMFCVYTSSKLSRWKFEFSLKVKVMGLNPGYLLKSFLLYLKLRFASNTFWTKFPESAIVTRKKRNQRSPKGPSTLDGDRAFLFCSKKRSAGKEKTCYLIVLSSRDVVSGYLDIRILGYPSFFGYPLSRF